MVKNLDFFFFFIIILGVFGGKLMTEIFLIRHGESVANHTQVLCGLTDLPLSETGLAQVARTAEHLKDRGISAIYSSPLKRAFQTAEALAAVTGLEVKTVYDFREVWCGEWEGKPIPYIISRWGEDYRKFVDCDETLKNGGGESLIDGYARFSSAMTEIAEKEDGRKIAVTAHAGIIRAFCGYASGGRPGDLQYMANAAYAHIFYRDGKFDIAEYDVNGFLEGLVTKMTFIV
jgi:broad specificity phosphatase PhoE